MTEQTKIEIFGKRLERVISGFEKLKHLGMDEEILIAFIQYKTKFSLRDIKLFLRAQDDFLCKLQKEEILESLK